MGVTYIRRRANSGSNSGNEAISKTGQDIVFIKSVYKNLSSLTDNKNVTVPTESKTQYESFLLDMQELSVAIDAGDTSSIAPELIEFNSYLGSLGISDEYPFDGKFDLADWYKSTTDSSIRNVSYGTDNVVSGTDNVQHNLITG